MTSAESAPQEIESALFVCSAEPQATCEQIASRTELAGYLLLPQESETIHDVYFDTRQRALTHKRLGLRLRHKGTKLLLTLKADAQATAWGGVTRLERELPWSRDAMKAIISELGKLGIRLELFPPDFDQADPATVMRRLGLAVIQDRETHRQIRNIVQPHDDIVLAELAIDALTYHFQNQAVHCYEIEIEEKSKEQPDLLRQLVDELITLYAPSLRPWQYGKLATGIVLEQLLRAEAQDALLTPDNHVKPEACDRLENYLRSLDTPP